MLLKSLVILGTFLSLSAYADIGTIEKVGAGSTVKVLRGGITLHLKVGDELKAGDEVSTDANTAVDIRLEDETLIRLGTSSSYKVQEDSKVHQLVHRLLSGVVRVLVKPTDRDHTDPHIKFKMLTQEGTIGVRGTEFVVTRNSKGTDLKGIDGEVVFGPANADFANLEAFQMVHRGFESHIAAGAKTATSPEKFDLQKYQNDLNAPNNKEFGPVSAAPTPAKTNRYERPAEVAAAKPVTGNMPSAPAQPKVAAATPVTAPKAMDKSAAQTAFINAVFDKDIAAAKKALANGAKVNGKAPGQEQTALQIALTGAKTKADFDMFDFLIVKGADVDGVDDEGHTPLMYAAIHHLAMDYVKLLVNPGGANILKETKDHETAESLAKKNGYLEMAAYLGSTEAYEDANQVLDSKPAAKAKKK